MTIANGVPKHITKAIAAIAEISPDLAARIATFAVTRTKRRPLRTREEVFLARAERLEIAHGRHRIAAWSWGSGPTVHLVHGWNGRAAQLTAFVDPLVAAGMRVIAHDSVGHGASTGSSSHVVAMAETLFRVVEATAPARAVVAHSLGAAATAIALSRGLVTGRTTFIGAPADTSRWPEQVFRLTGPAADSARAYAEERLGSSYARLAMSELGQKIRPPVLVVHDRSDDVVPFDDALTIVRSIRDAGLLVTNRLSHTSILRAAEVVEDVVRFTAADVIPRRTPVEAQETLDNALFARGFPIGAWQAA